MSCFLPWQTLGRYFREQTALIAVPVINAGERLSILMESWFSESAATGWKQPTDRRWIAATLETFPLLQGRTSMQNGKR